MNRRVVWTIVVPLLVIAVVVGLIVGFGSLLLFIREATHDALMPVWAALAGTLLIAAIATVVAANRPAPGSTTTHH